MNWLTSLANPRSYAVKKMMFEFLNERYPTHDQTIERLANSFQTENDIQAFIKLVVDIYEKGYLRSVEDHREQLAKAGLQVKVIKPNQT